VEFRDGAFPQISGMTMTYNPTAPPGRRIIAIAAGGRALEPDRDYIVATHDFLAAGGDAYQAFGEVISAEDLMNPVAAGQQGPKLVYNDPGRWLRDILADTIRANRAIRPVVENRIVERFQP